MMAVRSKLCLYLRHASTRSSSLAIWPTLSQRSLHETPCACAGHNKWSKIKRPKMAADLERSKQTGKICSEIVISVRLNGDNPDSNLRLASVLTRAKKFGIPKATISNAIQAGLKTNAAGGSESLTMVGRGPSDYSLIIEAITDNKRRTRPEIKSLLSKQGGEALPGMTSFQFHQKGVVWVSNESIEESMALELAIMIGAEDVVHEYSNDFEEHCYKFICDTQDLRNVISKAEEENLDILRSSLEYIPTTIVSLSSDALQKAKEVVSLLKDHPEVTNVYYNFHDISES